MGAPTGGFPCRRRQRDTGRCGRRVCGWSDVRAAARRHEEERGCVPRCRPGAARPIAQLQRVSAHMRQLLCIRLRVVTAWALTPTFPLCVCLVRLQPLSCRRAADLRGALATSTSLRTAAPRLRLACLGPALRYTLAGAAGQITVPSTRVCPANSHAPASRPLRLATWTWTTSPAWARPPGSRCRS